MTEIWKPIAGYEGLYEVSNLGNIKSLRRNKIMKQGTHSFGYKYVILYKNNKSKNLLVHRLVAEAFISKIEGKTDVNHIDGIKYNNSADNLEWVSKSENMYHAYRTGIRCVTEKQRGLGRYHNTAPAVEKLKQKVRCIETGKFYSSMAEADRDIGCSAGQVSNSIKQGCSIYGYTFEKI